MADGFLHETSEVRSSCRSLSDSVLLRRRTMMSLALARSSRSARCFRRERSAERRGWKLMVGAAVEGWGVGLGTSVAISRFAAARTSCSEAEAGMPPFRSRSARATRARVWVTSPLQ